MKLCLRKLFVLVFGLLKRVDVCWFFLNNFVDVEGFVLNF